METPEEIKETAIELFSVMSGIPRDKDGDVVNAMRGNFITGYINAYTKCQEDNSNLIKNQTKTIGYMHEEIRKLNEQLSNTDKKYTLDDMKKACAVGIDIVNKEGENNFQPFEDLINSLNKK